MTSPPQRALGIYVHWPFCAAKCPYCDFNSHVSSGVEHDVWARALVKELHRYRAQTGPRAVQSIFFGGGTPSLMAPKVVAEVIDTCVGLWSTEDDLEVTLEANPTSSERKKFKMFREAGVSRLSMGVQALDDRALKALGRLHSHQEALTAFKGARETFERVSFDLIYGRQHQTLKEWEGELALALSLAVDHLSLYQLTIEPGTAFGDRHARGRLSGLPSDGLGADMYEVTQAMCDAAGMPAYEVSNHARPGAQSRHNLIYWRCEDYVGVGPGAHGRLTIEGERFATEAHLMPNAWLAEVAKDRSERARTKLTAQDQIHEMLLMGLRLSEGVPVVRLAELGWSAPEKVEHLRVIGMLERDETRLIATKQGRLVLNSVISELY